MGGSTKQRTFVKVMKYFTNGHRSFVVDLVTTFLVAARLKDCWHKGVPFFFIEFFHDVTVKSHVILFTYVVLYVMITFVNLSVWQRFTFVSFNPQNMDLPITFWRNEKSTRALIFLSLKFAIAYD